MTASLAMSMLDSSLALPAACRPPRRRGATGETSAMLELSIHIDVPDFSKHSLEVPCPRCNLATPTTLGAISRGELMICRGCKSNIRLIDHVGELERFVRRLRRQLRKMQEGWR